MKSARHVFSLNAMNGRNGIFVASGEGTGRIYNQTVESVNAKEIRAMANLDSTCTCDDILKDNADPGNFFLRIGDVIVVS